MSDMFVKVNGTRLLAERACRMLFAEDTSKGPVMPVPEPLLGLLADWPGPTDQPIRVALQTPVNFDIGREMSPGDVQSIVLTVNRIDVLDFAGNFVGVALRTDKYGFNAIKAWQDITAANRRLS